MLHRRHEKRLLDALRNSVESCASDGIHKLNHIHARVRRRCESKRRRMEVCGPDKHCRSRMEYTQSAQSGHTSAAAEAQVGGVNRIVRGRQKKPRKTNKRNKDAKRG